MYACLWKFFACIQIKGLLHLLNFNMNTVSGYLSCGKDRTKQRASKQLITLMVYYWQPMRSVYTEEHHRVWYKIWISNKLYALRSRSKLFIILEKKNCILFHNVSKVPQRRALSSKSQPNKSVLCEAFCRVRITTETKLPLAADTHVKRR